MPPSKKLETFFTSNSDFEYEVILNNNRSTFLRLLKRNRKIIRLSLHQFFLKAPLRVLKAVQKYVENRCQRSALEVRSFALKSLNELDYSSSIKQNDLKPAGKFYNLQKIFKKLNDRYFNSSLSLYITWVPSPKYPKKRSFTFASYEQTLRLIRVNELLDNPFCPEYFVEYVIFHEMLHHQLPIRVSAKGRREIHSLEFKKQEKEFLHYRQAKEWEKNFANQFIKDRNS